jgi:integrase
MKKQKLTKGVIDRLSFAEAGKRYEAWDADLKGFGVRVSASEKTFVIFKRIGSKLTRITLGKHGVLTVDEARKRAIKALSELGDGIDVNAKKARARVRGKTLQEVLNKYVDTKQLKPNTILDYGKVLRLYASDWLNKPLADITSEMVSSRHLKIAKEIGSVPANKLGRYLRLLFNFGIANKHTEVKENPVHILSVNGQWRDEPKRDTLLKASELPSWFDAVMGLEQPITRTSMLMMLFTGLRKVEALSLRWGDVDFQNGTFTVSETKNKRSHTLTMSDYIRDLFEKALVWRQNEFVFPGDGATGHLTETRRQIEVVERKAGLKIGNHDLRRTFATIAETVCSYTEVKQLMNHAVPDSDVTNRYIGIEAGYRAEPAMMRVSNAIMLAAHAWCPYEPAATQPEAEPEKVINLEERRKAKAA